MPFRFPGPSPAARRLLLLVCIGPFALAGCQSDEPVSRYTAPKDPVDPDTVSDEPGEGEPSARVLGAIAPVGKAGDNDWYFFKIGPTRPRAVERQSAAFDEFIRSLKFSDAGPPSWTVPAGWKEVGTQGKDRIATFKMKKSETVVELTVTRFGGSLIDNINRWRVQQAGAAPITEAEIDTRCQVLDVDGRRIVVVDVSGPGGQGGMMVPPFAK